MNLKSRFLQYYEKFIRLKGTPDSLAFGLAIGVFIGVTPTIPFHTALIIILCYIFKKNITAAYFGSWMISNPLTIPFFYFSQYHLGKFILGNNYSAFYPEKYSLLCIIERGWGVIIPLLLGGVIMAPLFAVPIYFIARKTIVAVRARIDEHRNKDS